MKALSVTGLLDRLRKRDWRVLGRAITIVENEYEGKDLILNYAYRTAREDCLIVGITGAGGAGKSTLIDKVIQFYRGIEKRVGVMTVDPSSPYTGGAVLGDRIRMGAHNKDMDVFIRSFGSRGTFGGISQAAKESLYLYKSFGFDVIILETLGVGQAETDISNFVDVTAVVLAPGNGDNIQLAKAGIREIADIFVVNKADKPEAETLRLQLLSTFDVIPQEQRPLVAKTIATENHGIAELVELFQEVSAKLLPVRGTKKQARIENEVLTGAITLLENKLKHQAHTFTADVLVGNLTPYEAALQLSQKIYIEDR
jgi:LAO/AO transport system kinase